MFPFYPSLEFDIKLQLKADIFFFKGKFSLKT